MRRGARIALAALLLVVAAGCFVTALRLDADPPAGADAVPDARLVASLRHLSAALDDGAADDMQRLFPEGFVFTHALVGLSWARIAQTDERRHVEALTEARRSLDAIASDAGQAPFPRDQNPPGGVFYAGWSTYLAGQIAQASGDAAEARTFQTACARLGAAFDASDSPYPTSYPGHAWPADASVGAAALALHDELFTPRYTETLARWSAGVEARLDVETDLVAHAADPASGAPRGGARGSSQMLTLRFLAQVDPALARTLYRRARTAFVTTRLGLPVVLEYPAGFSGTADIDSGPLPLGVGLPATVVGLGTARVMGDSSLAAPLDRELEALGLPVQLSPRRAYGFGLVPVGEAFLVWARLAPMALARPFAPVADRPWGFVVALDVAAFLLVLLAIRLARRRRVLP